MKKVLFPLIVLLAIALSACNLTGLAGSGKIITSTRPVSGFTKLIFETPGELTITQTDKESLNIEGDDNLLDEIKTEVENGELHIYLNRDVMQIKPTKPIRYTLSVKTLEQISLTGSGNINAGEMKSDQLTVNVTGSGDMSFKSLKAKTLNVNVTGSGNISGTGLSADELQAAVSGSGDCDLTGKVTRQNVRIVGSGNYSARSLESTQADVSVTGSGDSEVWASETVSITVMGSGKVGVMGKPKVTQQIFGSGSVYSLQ